MYIDSLHKPNFVPLDIGEAMQRIEPIGTILGSIGFEHFYDALVLMTFWPYSCLIECLVIGESFFYVFLL